MKNNKYITTAITLIVTWIILLGSTATLAYLYLDKSNDYDSVYYHRTYEPGEKFSFRNGADTLFNCTVTKENLDCNMKGTSR